MANIKNMLIQQPSGRIMLVEENIREENNVFYREGVAQEGFLSGFENPYTCQIPNDGNMTLVVNIDVPLWVKANEARFDQATQTFETYGYIGGKIEHQVELLAAQVATLTATVVAAIPPVTPAP